MKALSVRQPWASVICTGLKEEETRTDFEGVPFLVLFLQVPRQLEELSLGTDFQYEKPSQCGFWR
jgi:hypothetical protein